MRDHGQEQERSTLAGQALSAKVDESTTLTLTLPPDQILFQGQAGFREALRHRLRCGGRWEGRRKPGKTGPSSQSCQDICHPKWHLREDRRAHL